MPKTALALKSSELREGDTVHTAGLDCLIDGPIQSRDYPEQYGQHTVYWQRALVLNRDDVPDSRVPLSWTREPTGEHRWQIQGNDNARWSVTRPTQ